MLYFFAYLEEDFDIYIIHLLLSRKSYISSDYFNILSTTVHVFISTTSNSWFTCIYCRSQIEFYCLESIFIERCRYYALLSLTLYNSDNTAH